VEAPIFAVYQARYKTRFIWNLKKAVAYHAIIAFVPKGNLQLSDIQIKALLAYLNSSFVQLYIESVGRTTGGVGPIGLEVNQAANIPIIAVEKIDNTALEELASLFDKLDGEARKIGGADKQEQVMQLWNTVIAEIDNKIVKILSLPEYFSDVARTLAQIMVERRVGRGEQPQPTAMRGTTEMPPLRKQEKEKHARRTKSSGHIPKLDRFME